MTPTPPPSDDATVRTRVLRHFFGASLAAALVGALLFLFIPPTLGPLQRTAVVAAFLGLAGLSALGRRTPPGNGMAVMLAVTVMAIVIIAMAGWLQGTGTGTPGLVFLGLIVCMVAAVSPPRATAWVAAAALGALVVLSWVDSAVGRAGASLTLQRVFVSALSVLVGLAAGLALARLSAAQVAAAGAREQRFRTLLGIAVLGYWETDSELMLTQLLRRNAKGGFDPVVMPRAPLGSLRELSVDPDPLAEVRQTMERRQPFRDLPARWTTPAGLRHLRISGEPNFAADGRFLGYWGVAREVTEEWLAQQALVESRTLLATVFDLSPDVITLTDLDSGRLELVNQRFCEVFGLHADQARGQTAESLGLWADPSGPERLHAAIRAQATVRDLPLRYRFAEGREATLLVAARRFERDGRHWLIGVSRDVSREEWDRRERDAMLSHAPVGLVFARDGLVRKANAEAERLFGAAPGGLAGRGVMTLLADPALGPEIREHLFALFDTGRPLAIDLELRRLEDGRTFTAMVRASPVDAGHPRDGTVWIVQDITERRRMESALAAARDQAEAANRAKSGFLANTSHEIRTPLHGLLGLAQLARQPGLDEDRRSQYLDQIVDSAQNLSAIISDILDLSKIEAGKLEVERVTFDLHELLRSLHRAYAALAAAQDLACELHLAPGLPQRVGGDPLRLRQVLANFLNNALKFTADGRVDIEAAPAPGGRVRITVCDSGPGISAEAQARLFRPFTQADESTTRRFGGTGLGLSICRELALLMGGEVGLDSRPGQGSRFHVELPLPEQQADDPGSGFGALDTGRLDGARVLLVEDNAVNTLIAVAMLERWGMQVTAVDSGEAALEAFDARPGPGAAFDVVLMDVQMPGMSGHEATRALRQRLGPEALPVIALTAAALTSERDEALAAGMTDFVTKPIDSDRLRRALLQALNP